ncbi:Polyketide cyclase / dehydrase and lipid transport [Actinacidiphila yanglinensis]|uniref:Polyketide cyclase / dehydrase and lipid transport n=1 Tax=Actinacidiphila yanglinensis TaxID=310779 RepID=A0A1H6CJQ8_9ACTN|nr:SRPBCC family protein [Actinacidiphila yanglinensis]SEG73214.1 Polyketide cyclase / dehydrase and lipid transport [Actinacidiphila yanglinensis]
MDWSHYRFRSSWRLDAEPDTVYRLLERPDQYPEWWPQVREVRQTGETSGVLRFRSALPYDLVVTARSTRHDPEARVLEVAMTGDLDGWVRWTVQPAPAGATRLLFEQEVRVRKRLMRVLAVPCRPLFRANHAAMMRSCRRGLSGRLAAARLSV